MTERIAYFFIAGIDDVYDKKTKRTKVVYTSDKFQIGRDSSIGKNSPEHNNLNISFEVHYKGNSIVPLPAKFAIDNVDENLKKYIVTNVNLFQERKRSIQFWCGYQGNERLLFDGRIEKAWYSGLPDSTLYINAWTALNYMGMPVNVKFNNIKAIDLLEKAIKACGMTINIPYKLRQHQQLQRIISSFSYEDSAYAYLTKVIKDITSFNLVKNQILISIENNVVYVRHADKKNTENPVVIGYWNGMVGRPEPTIMGVNVRTILDPGFYVGQTIDLVSTEDDLYNGLYNIQETIFHGNTQEEEFYTDLVCQKVIG